MVEHVEVVIKIPKYYLTHPQDYTCLAECVRRGTPLPEHHGRLIDADAVDTRYSDPEVVETLNDAPTIIEAEGSERE